MRIAEEADRLTGGAVKMQAVGGDIGHGTRYIDGIEQLVWLGEQGAQEAAVYYAHAAINYVERDDRIREVSSVMLVASDPHLISDFDSVREWADRGANVGEYRWRRDRGLL